MEKLVSGGVGWSDVPEGGNSAFRFFTVEVALL